MPPWSYAKVPVLTKPLDASVKTGLLAVRLDRIGCAVRVATPVIVVAGVIVTAPVETEPMPIVPEPLALTVRLASEPESVTTTATVPAVVAPVIFSPATCDPVDESTVKAGLVAPFRPTANDVAEADATESAPESTAAAAVKVPVSVGLSENTKFVLVVPVAPLAL